MNTSPSPTPYDIVEIPSFPFIPSITLWLGLASIGLVSYFIFRLISIKSAQKKIENLSIVLKELERFMNTPPNLEEASLISIMIKRYLASESGRFGSSLMALPSCSEKEILSIKNGCSIPQVQNILGCLVELESARFRNGKVEVSPISSLHSYLISVNAREIR